MISSLSPSAAGKPLFTFVGSKYTTSDS